jgi:arylsulfatase A-like enzyme
VTVRTGDRLVGVYRLAERVRVEMPADLPTGRVPVSLEFSSPRGVVLQRASVRPCRAGSAEIDDGRVLQSGWSTVETVRPLSGRARVTGRFTPPTEPTPDQRFVASVDDGTSAGDTVFEWHGSLALEARAEIEFEAPIESESGFVRLRLKSEGRGPAGRWSDLSVSSKRAVASAEREPAPSPPRLVVLYVMDALRADALGHLGSDRGASPVLDRLASEGVSFFRHFSVAPNTPTSTVALFTGWCAIRGGALPEDGPETLAESFTAAGYRTAAVASNPYISATHGLTRGFESVDLVRFEEDFRRRAASTPNDSADRVHRAALAWIDSLAEGDRAFLYLHTLHPHNPYTPPEPFPRLFASGSTSTISGDTGALVDIRDGKVAPSVADRQRLQALYAANLAYNDERLGQLLEQLESRFSREETLLVVTSDHGEELFDHGGVLHGFTLYDEMVRIPLIVWWPSEIAPSKVESSTDTLDLHTTLRATVSAHQPPGIGGRSLWPAMSGTEIDSSETAVRFAFAAGERPLYMARSDRWKLILAPGRGFDWGMGRGRARTFDSEYLFDLEQDPGERVNVAGSIDPEVAWLRSRLRAWIDGWHRHHPEAVDPIVDEATREQLEALGYAE